ncbi:hypothetical protein HID58_058986 [Brassica napus]|uniref:Uncharacterized protein n=1 Tax=Brassica napus TaxID=3708 RepID=A0ABQ7ZRL1_BRANA|nr:hypothetical protein HID58_058986 [Brassica napus]
MCMPVWLYWTFLKITKYNILYSCKLRENIFFSIFFSLFLHFCSWSSSLGFSVCDEGSKPRTDRNNHQSSIFVLVFSEVLRIGCLTCWACWAFSRIVGSAFLLHVKEILNPESTVGAPSWVYYSVYAFFVFLFNIFDIANLPKEIADYLNKMGARIPNIKPGKATIEYLTKIQASTRFWDKAKLSLLHSFWQQHLVYLTSIYAAYQVGSIIELRRSYHAYNVMQSLSKALKMYGV